MVNIQDVSDGGLFDALGVRRQRLALLALRIGVSLSSTTFWGVETNGLFCESKGQVS